MALGGMSEMSDFLPPEQELRNAIDIIVYGTNGSGKTNFMQHLADVTGGVIMTCDPPYHVQTHCDEKRTEGLTWVPVGYTPPVVYFAQNCMASEEMLSLYTDWAWPKAKKIILKTGEDIIKQKESYVNLPSEVPFEINDEATGEYKKTLLIPKFVHLTSDSNPKIRLWDFYAPTESCLKNDFLFSIHVEGHPTQSFEKLCERARNQLLAAGVPPGEILGFRKNVKELHNYGRTQVEKLRGLQDLTFTNKYDGSDKSKSFAKYAGGEIKKRIEEKNLII